MGYEVLRDEKEIVLSWPHPFTWEDYPITGYDIVCRETESEKIIHDMTLNDTDILNEPVVNHTVDLPPCVSDCYTLQCTVTASNAIGQSNISVTNIFFPKSKLLFCSVNATGFHCVHSFCVFLLFKTTFQLSAVFPQLKCVYSSCLREWLLFNTPQCKSVQLLP